MLCMPFGVESGIKRYRAIFTPEFRRTDWMERFLMTVLLPIIELLSKSLRKWQLLSKQRIDQRQEVGSGQIKSTVAQSITTQTGGQ